MESPVKLAHATQQLVASLEADSSTPDFGAADREAYLNSERAKLRALSIPPVPVKARTSEWARTHGEFPESEYDMIAVAGCGHSWLLFDPETGFFSLADGDLNGNLVLVGFRSADALAEWLG